MCLLKSSIFWLDLSRNLSSGLVIPDRKSEKSMITLVFQFNIFKIRDVLVKKLHFKVILFLN